MGTRLQEETESKFGLASAIPAFLPRPGEDFLQGPHTAINPSGVYHRRDAGYDQLFQRVNTKPIMMGKWKVCLSPAAAEHERSRQRRVHRSTSGRPATRSRRGKESKEMGKIVTNGSELMLEQDWIHLTVASNHDVVVRQSKVRVALAGARCWHACGTRGAVFM